MSEVMCPNCGRHLVNYRTDRQLAGRREVELKWMICVNCRHVALDTWSFADGVIPQEMFRENGHTAPDRVSRAATRHEKIQKRA